MSKSRILRLGNSLLLGLIVLMGAVFFQSHGAQAQDPFGTDCQPQYINLNGSCNGSPAQYDTGKTSCATSPTNRCCTYEVFRVVCADGKSLGYIYRLKKAGLDGHFYTCSPTAGCIQFV